MRKLFASALTLAVLAPAGASAQVELTGNAGFMSEDFYRGILQNSSAANGGLDLASGMFSAGTWAADVGDGSEIDLYAGVGFPLGESASLYLGGTGYFYTGDFDTMYLEGNVGLAFGPFAIDAALGTHDEDPLDDTKYFYLALTAAAPNGLYATVGSTAGGYAEFGDTFGDIFDNDLAAQYLEAGYGFSAAELDFSIFGLWQNSVAALAATDNVALAFTVSKGFTIPTS
jgi:uncharacterized protein (TIGR02001 family)